MRSPKITAQLNRLRVFNATKAFMEKYARAPDPWEIDGINGLSRSLAKYHLYALNGAEGLPLPTITGRGQQKIREDSGKHVNNSETLAVDVVMRGQDGALDRAGFRRRDVFKDVGA